MRQHLTRALCSDVENTFSGEVVALAQHLQQAFSDEPLRDYVDSDAVLEQSACRRRSNGSDSQSGKRRDDDKQRDEREEEQIDGRATDPETWLATDENTSGPI